MSKDRLRFERPTRARMMPKNRFPHDMGEEAIQKAIDAKCGCDGKWDCDCVSIFNGVCGEQWSRYNTRPGQ